MGTVEMVEQNVESASRRNPFIPQEMAAIETMFLKLQSVADLYCTGCGYCMPCPNGVDIPGNFLLVNYHRVHGLEESSRRAYRRLRNGNSFRLLGTRIEGKAASECVQCGECEPKCPQSIRIMEQLEEVHRALSAS